MSARRRGDHGELDRHFAAIVGVAGDREVPEDHGADWFGEPRCVRESSGGPGGRRPEVVTDPAEIIAAAEPVWQH